LAPLVFILFLPNIIELVAPFSEIFPSPNRKEPFVRIVLFLPNIIEFIALYSEIFPSPNKKEPFEP
jgi:hypothetical protein